MPMRKRIFLFNMLMMVAAMLILFLVLTGFIRYRFQSAMENREWLVDVDENAVKVERILGDAADCRETDWNSLKEEVGKYDYMLFVCVNGAVRYPEGLDEEAENWLMEAQENDSRGIHTVFENTYIDVSYLAGEDACYLLAIHLLEIDPAEVMNTDQSLAFIYRTVAIGIVTILIVVCLGWIFSKKLVDRVAESLDLLVDSLKKVGRGERAEPIICRGDKEIQLACEAFNTMQENMQALEEARRRDEERRTDMVTSISHDLRTPLTSMKGYIKAVLDGVADSPEKQAEFLQIAYETTGEMDELLQKLFVFSKIETGKMPLYPAKINMKEYLTEYIEKRKSAYLGENLDIALLGGEMSDEGDYDVLQMQRVFDNLLENSIRYAGSSPVKVEITLKETDEEELIRFHDNGCGVPEEKLPYIFDRFYRCDEARGQEGNGVGLYIVKYIVEAHGGSVEAHNEDGFSVIMHFPKGGTYREQDTDRRG